jgi:hypothetical protein
MDGRERLVYKPKFKCRFIIFPDLSAISSPSHIRKDQVWSYTLKGANKINPKKSKVRYKVTKRSNFFSTKIFYKIPKLKQGL